MQISGQWATSVLLQEELTELHQIWTIYLGWSDLKCSLCDICRIHFRGSLETLQRARQSISSAAETEVQRRMEDRQVIHIKMRIFFLKKHLLMYSYEMIPKMYF